MKNGKHWLRGLGGILAGGVCLWLSLRGVEIDQVVKGLAEISWLWVGIAMLGVVMVSVSKALRWQWLYPRDAPSLSWTAHFSVLLIGQMLNLVVPVRLGEIARMGLMRQEQRPVAMTLGTIVVEKSLDLIAVGLLLLLVVPATLLPAWLRPAAGPGALLTGGGLLVLLGLLVAFRHLLLRWLAVLPRPRREPWARWVGRLVNLLETALQGISVLGSGRLFPVLGLTAFTWLLSAGVIQVMLLAFQIEQRWMAALALMLALTFSNLAPTPPALVGLVGVVTEAVLVPFGVSRPQALALGTILNIVLVGPPVILGGWAATVRFLRLIAAPGWGKLRQALGLLPADFIAGKE